MSDKKIKTVTQVKSNQPCENKRQALSQIKRIDWKSLEFRTPNQKTFYHTISRNDVTFAVGPAGCGKTFLATHYALKNLAKGKYDKMVITKPLVEVDGEKMGYLPGDIDEKTIEYRDITPYWSKRLESRHYDVIQFRNGYAKVAPVMIVEYKGMIIEPMKKRYCIQLGKVLESKNVTWTKRRFKKS